MRKKANKRVQLILRLDKSEAQSIKAAAARESRSVNQWCRVTLGEAIRKAGK